MNQSVRASDIIKLTQLIYSDFFSYKTPNLLEVTLCSSAKNIKSLMREFAQTQIRPTLICNHLHCNWHSGQQDGENINLDIDEGIFLKTDILILDSYPKLIDQAIARNINASFIIEVIPLISLNAQKRLMDKGRCLISHFFFDRYRNRLKLETYWNEVKISAHDYQIPLALALTKIA